MTKRTSIKNIEIILAVRGLQKMISDTETPEVINVLKQARNALIKIYAEDDKEELHNILTAIERMNKKQYHNQLCCYNGEILTLRSLSMRFRRARMPNPDIEAKKYLIGGNDD